MSCDPLPLPPPSPPIPLLATLPSLPSPDADKGYRSWTGHTSSAINRIYQNSYYLFVNYSKLLKICEINEMLPELTQLCTEFPDFLLQYLYKHYPFVVSQT